MTPTAKGAGSDARVEYLPFLGRSWYTRGVSYWMRRALLTVMMLGVLAILTTMTGGLISAIVTESMPTWAKVLILSAVAAAIGHGMIRCGRAFHTANRVARRRGVVMTMAEALGEPKRGARDRQRRTVAGSSALGVLAMAGGGALLVVSAPFNIGWGVVLVLASCQKYVIPEEFGAWQKIERRGSP